MTTTTERTEAPAARTGNPWAPTPRGVLLVTRIELMRRRPSTKGTIFYGVVVLGIITLGILVSAFSNAEKDSVPLELVLVLVLGAGFLIAPSLSATSVNGDSTEGVLAPLQMTRLTPGDLAVGKVLASWAVAFAALLTTVPFLVYAYLRAGWHLDELLLVLAVILFEVLVATTIGLAWSSLAARAVASVSLAHITTGALLLGTLLLFFFTQPLVSESTTVTVHYIDYSQVDGDPFADPNVDPTTLPCVEQTQTYDVYHTEKTAWLLLLNPVVVVGESAPIVDPETYEEDGRAAPGLFAMMHQGVAGSRLGPQEQVPYDECSGAPYPDDPWMERQQEQANLARAPWLGLGVHALIALGAMTIVIRRLRVPYTILRAGSRVA